MSRLTYKGRSGAGRLALFAATIIWGSSFVLMKNIVVAIPPFYLLAIRFTAATFFMAAAAGKNLRVIDRGYIVGGAVMGALLFAAYALQTFGVIITTPGKNAFFTSFQCIVVPFLYWLAAKRRPNRYNISAALIFIVGIGLISLEKTSGINGGDMLTLAGGVVFGIHIIAVAVYIWRRDALPLTMVQFAATAVIAWLFAFIFETPPQGIKPAELLNLAYLSVFATSLCYLFQIFGQKTTAPSSAALILSLEAVFGTIFSVVFYHETLTPRLLAGFAIIFSAVVISETRLEFLKRPRQ